MNFIHIYTNGLQSVNNVDGCFICIKFKSFYYFEVTQSGHNFY